MGRVLRANQVQFVGPLQLSIDQATRTRNGAPRASASPRIRIVQNTPAYALLEITCSCGTITQVRCDYAGTDAAAPAEVPVNP